MAQEGETALHKACKMCNYNVLKSLIDYAQVLVVGVVALVVLVLVLVLVVVMVLALTSLTNLRERRAWMISRLT